ncbi:alkaline phosphatase D family protein [Thiomicrorhabdus sp.]|uniref:alkaline phosphatase D family protein n=1 Tax=Thiomicrorhabdus sp. TaxID=2039724 RepID=UPI0029C861BB|nr:alkaline phosphatase D family protein [Thiomicrorhabdus sp.]
MADNKSVKEQQPEREKAFGRRAFLGRSALYGGVTLPLLSGCGNGSSTFFNAEAQEEDADSDDQSGNGNQNSGDDQSGNDGEDNNNDQSGDGSQDGEEEQGFNASGYWQYRSDLSKLELNFDVSTFNADAMPRMNYVLPVAAMLDEAMYWTEGGGKSPLLLQWVREPVEASIGGEEASGIWSNAFGYRLTLNADGTALLEYDGESTDGDGFCGLNRLTANPFLQGVASGDPQSESLVLWSRFSPEEEALVNWSLAEDPLFQRPVQSGTLQALAEKDFCLKVQVSGLQANKQYYYRFEPVTAVDEHNRVQYSLIGRAKTLPVADAALDQLRVAVVSCASYPHGYFNGYRQVARHDDLDYVLHLGDYIYEYPGADAGADNDYADADAISAGRTYDADNRKEIVNLEDYRRRHQHYKEDADLQLLHSRYAFITTWDDHETADNSWDPDGSDTLGGAVNHSESSEGVWETRKSVAVQAYNEWMPITPINDFADPQIYRSFSFGTLAELMILDTRIQGRHQQPNVLTDDYNDPDRRLISEAQEAWLKERLRKSHEAGRTWKLLGQQVMMGQFKIPMASIATGLSDPSALPEALRENFEAFQNRDFFTGNPLDSYQQLVTMAENSKWLEVANTDQWDGYNANRQRIWDYVRDQDIDNLVVLTGDIHTSWAMELVKEPVNPWTETYGVEFVTTSITSPGLVDTKGVLEGALKVYNPHIKYTDLSKHGYLLLTLNPQNTTAEWYHLEDILDRNNNNQSISARYRVAAGSHSLEKA